MLKFECNEGKQKIEVQGLLEEVLADLTLLIECIYEKIDSKTAKEAFEYGLEMLVKNKMYKKSEEELKEMAMEALLKMLFEKVKK